MERTQTYLLALHSNTAITAMITQDISSNSNSTANGGTMIKGLIRLARPLFDWHGQFDGVGDEDNDISNEDEVVTSEHSATFSIKSTIIKNNNSLIQCPSFNLSYLHSNGNQRYLYASSKMDY